MQPREHWDRVYSGMAAEAVSWYQEHADRSLGLIRRAGVPLDAPLIDVGGGASTLVDDLLAANYRDITVLDLSDAALATARTRLGDRAGSVRWLTADVTTASLPAHAYALWHDRAVFHFLTAPEDRRAYVKQVLRSVRPGGHVIVATFAEDGPLRCSGLPVMRYDAAGLHAEFGDAFELVEHERELHRTPSGATQPFTWCHCRAPAA